MKTVLIGVWLATCWIFSFSFPSPFLDPKSLIFYLGSGCLFIYLLSKRTAPVNVHSFWIILAWYFFLCVLSISMSMAKYEGVLELARLLLWCGLGWSFSRLSAWDTLAKWSLVSAAVMAGFAGFLAVPGRNDQIIPLGHVSYYGNFMAMHIPMAAYLLFTDRKWWKVLWGVCLFFVSGGLILSGARASMIGVVAGLLVALILLRNWKAVIAAVAIPIVIMMAVPHVFNLYRFTKKPSVDFNLTQKRGFTATLRMIRDRPLGWGLGNFRFVYPEYAKSPSEKKQSAVGAWYEHPHNEMLHQAVEVGILGWLFWLLGIVWIYFCGWRERNNPVVVFGLSGLTVALVGWQLDTNFLQPLSRFMAAFYVGILWQPIKRHAPVLWNISEVWVKRVGVTVAILCMLIVSAHQVSIYAVEKAKRSTDRAEMRKWTVFATRLSSEFNSVYTNAATKTLTFGAKESASEIEGVFKAYPYVPVVLYLKAVLSHRQGNTDEAKQLLKHALRNDPSYKAAEVAIAWIDR